LDDTLNFLMNDRLVWEQWVDDLRRFWLLARETGLFHEDKLEDLVPSKEEFVPGSIESERPPEYYKWFITKEMKTVRSFGQPLK